MTLKVPAVMKDACYFDHTIFAATIEEKMTGLFHGGSA